MHYADGNEVRLWDRVEAWPGCRAIVVVSVDTDEYSPAFPKEACQDLTQGVMLDTEQGGLVHYPEPDEDIKLISRGGPPTGEEVSALREEQARRAAEVAGQTGPPEPDCTE